AANCLASSRNDEYRARVIIDIDDFKSVNDTLGHAQGDRVLEKMGSILRTTFTDNDYIGRIGGDEFCVLVNTRSDSEEIFADMLIKQCEELRRKVKESGTGISVSIGTALFPRNGKDFETLYAACDKALYSSKKSGKNTVRTYDEVTESEG
ncbi:MAG: GGDEF domain-containing protein, partial [Ruminococcus sp.]|nr:GGDEF domain-containing protein [Ruminococcus sp.]